MPVSQAENPIFPLELGTRTDIGRRVNCLIMVVESYQKKLNLTRPNTYRSDLKRMSAYTAYSNPRGFIHQNKDKKNILIVKMEILLEPTSNKLMSLKKRKCKVLERSNNSAGNPVKEILLKLNLPDHRSILTDSKMDVKVLKITFSHSSQDKGTSSSLKSMITTSNHKLMIEVKDYEMKTKDKA
ncbi:hypothetical protein Tco_0734670 [Tanacetum coccineum]